MYLKCINKENMVLNPVRAITVIQYSSTPMYRYLLVFNAALWYILTIINIPYLPTKNMVLAVSLTLL